MKNKTYLIKLLCYIGVVLLLIFYPGNNIILSLFSKDPYAFKEIKPFTYKPQLLPYLSDINASPISAYSYLVMDLDSFTPLIAHNIHTRLLPASTVKLATALVSYNNYDLEEVITVKTVIEEENKMNLVKGEKISMLNLLYGTLINSANDGAYTLAEHYPGGVKEFVKEMNKIAQKLNMRDTHFENPIGFDDKNQYTTAYDLALLAREFARHPLLLNITSTKDITVSDISFTYFHHIVSSNELIGEIPHLGGLKTGSTEGAGEHLMSYYRIEDKPLLIIVLKSEDRFADTRMLINFLKLNTRYRDITLFQ